MARQYYDPNYSGVIDADENAQAHYVPDGPVVNEGAGAGPSQTISTPAINSLEAHGTPTITNDCALCQVFYVTGIPGAEAFGTLFIFPGDISTIGIPGEEAFGTATVILGLDPIQPIGITSEEAFGSHVIVNGSVGAGLILASGIASAEAFGTPTLSRGTAQAEGWDRLGSLDAGQPFGVLPPQDLEPFPNMLHQGFDSLTFRRWFEKLNIRVRSANQIHSTQLQLQTVNIADFGGKEHNALDGLQGGNGTERHHWSVQEKLDEQVRHWITIDT